jgi:hypothetical protein
MSDRLTSFNIIRAVPAYLQLQKSFPGAFSGYVTGEACFANLFQWTIPSRFTFILFSLRL